MNYVIPDIHNDNNRLTRLLRKIGFSREDHIFFLGDLFDRCSNDPDPLGVYFSILKIDDQCTVVSGNHDRWLANYICKYYGETEERRKVLPDYHYNSFRILKERLTEVDMLNLADWLLKLPLQFEAEVNGDKLLFAHAMTSAPGSKRDDMYYLMGDGEDDVFYTKGIDGYISFCGHSDSGYFSRYGGEYLDEENNSIWRNDLKNVYMMDCGCGFSDGRLACLCLEDMRRTYE